MFSMQYPFFMANKMNSAIERSKEIFDRKKNEPLAFYDRWKKI